MKLVNGHGHYIIIEYVFASIYCTDCLENPCLHNATCEDNLRNFTCTCKTGFKGRLCEKGM